MHGFNWLGWSMQVALGLVAGGVLTAGLILNDGLGMWHDPVAGSACSLGGALVLGSLAGRLGDRLWLGRGLLDDPAAPSHPVSRLLQRLMLALGIAAVGFAVIRFAISPPRP